VDPINEFRKEVAGNIEAQGRDRDVQDLSMRWFCEAQRMRYSYNFSWLGRPIIQYPQDIVAMQELIWSVTSAHITGPKLRRIPWPRESR
jgi:cephalosporin hydroxylase